MDLSAIVFLELREGKSKIDINGALSSLNIFWYIKFQCVFHKIYCDLFNVFFISNKIIIMINHSKVTICAINI